MEIAVIGGKDFCLGFRLAGIKKIFETNEPNQAVSSLKEDSSVGIAIFDENLTGRLDDDGRETLEDSLRPIYISLSKTASEDSLKKMIRKSIGVEI